MQRTLLQIARECAGRGHRVEVFAGSWRGALPGDLPVTVLGGFGLSNHGRCESFSRRLGAFLAGRGHDLVIGFNKMPGLDLYYAADPCFAARAAGRSRWFRLTGRCRSYLRLERAVFARESRTVILLIAEREKDLYMRHYGTAAERFELLPPGISRDRLAPPDAAEIRNRVRRRLSLAPEQLMVLMVGSGFRTKGVDRGIRALAALPAELRQRSRLFVAGRDEARPFARLARQLGVGERVHFLGGRKDVPGLLLAADLLLHPAYRETAGAVLLEAMAAGTPVLATDVCGFGFHVRQAGAGELVPSPFEQESLNRLLARMLSSGERSAWQAAGRAYVARTDVFSRPRKAAEIIERVAGC